MKHVVMYSGGIGSWAAARRVVEEHGRASLWLVFTDTLIEDADLYRWLVDSAADIYGQRGMLDGVIQAAAKPPHSAHREARRVWLDRMRTLLHPIMPRFVWLADGRTPWELFRDQRFLGNTRVDLCSRVLKRELADRWLAEHFSSDDTTVYVGIDWTEEHRYTRLRDRKLPWRYEAPLTAAPYLDKAAMLAEATGRGLVPPRLYSMGFAHNNCGGGCVKAGVGHWTHLYRTLPHVFAEWEANEEKLRADLGDVAILRDRTGGTTKPLPLSELRKRLDSGYQPDLFDIGGCGCFVDLNEEEAA